MIYVYGCGKYFEKDNNEAYKVLQKVADKEDPMYNQMMGLIYLVGTSSIDIDAEKAIAVSLMWRMKHFIDFRVADAIHGQPGEIGRLYENLPIRREACGVVMRSPREAKTLYLAGDTVWCEYVDAAIRDYRPDVIVVNAARAMVAPFGPIIMGLEDIGKVLEAAPKAAVVASHMDNVGHATLWRREIHAFVEKDGLQERLLIPEDGETCSF